ncbi:MAG TPA: type I-B CRISPR-associated endonuclease Cas1 [Firmicutes bacterium]|jgi:CRISPR-associated protein Cas1|nr:type I-B CRISPR-associated endonuclease Cas1 [Candidatus Fermentithermobacillaceae bacterium]
MRTMFVFSNGEIHRKDNTVMFDDGQSKRYLPIHEVDEMMVFGEVTLNKRFLEFCTQQEIIVHFFNFYGYYCGTYYPREHLASGHVLLKQVEHYLDSEKRILLAAGFVDGAVRNIRQVLKYYENRGKDVSDAADHAAKTLLDVYGCSSIENLMALEANMRNRYYEVFDSIVGNPEFRFEKRTRRPPRNYMNTLISFGNSILYTTVLSEIYKTHLDPRIGYLHATNFRRFTLNLDVAEVFKPIIVDRIIFSVVNERRIQENDFVSDSQGVFLSEKGKKSFVTEMFRKLETTVKHRGLGRSVSYRRLIRLELYKIAKHVLGEKAYRPFVASW